MKRITTLCTILFVTVLVVGCGDQKAPTALSEGVPGDDLSLSKAPPVVSTFSISFPFPNPCTGLVHTIFADITATIHFFQTNQKHHFNNRFQFDIVTSDGFSGSAVQLNVDNGTGLPGNPNEEFSFTQTVNVNLSNASGQRIITNIKFHITIRNQVIVRALVDNFSSNCVGKP